MIARFRIVADTDVLLASERSAHPNSPTREVFERWRSGEYQLLFSDDTLAEYAEKLLTHNVAPEKIRALLGLLRILGEAVIIKHFHLPLYPPDPDDIAFLLCAWNGEATHLISYDRHLLDLPASYRFRICPPIDFLQEAREI